MKHWKKFLFGTILFVLSLLLAIYTYAWLDPLPIAEARKSITIYDRNQQILYESNFTKNMEWISIDDIPEIVQDAFVCVEDKRFFYHAGFDPIRIVKAFLSNISHGSIVEGGSTITQQYAKNLFLTNEQSVSRKIQEFFYAARLEMQYSKEEILEGYLNTLYYGHGIYGIHRAAHFFFNRELKDLSIAQIAMLAGIPNGPSIYSPLLQKENAKQRQQLILSIFLNSGLIDESQYEQAVHEELIYADHQQENDSYGNEEYFVTAILQQLEAKGYLDQYTTLRVYTDYDPELQTALMNGIHTYIPSDSELECAGIVMEPFSGHVLDMSGGKD